MQYTYCRFCGQPIKSDNSKIKAKPGEYEHARGCPADHKPIKPVPLLVGGGAGVPDGGEYGAAGLGNPPPVLPSKPPK